MRRTRFGAALAVTGLVVAGGATTAAGVDPATDQPTSLAEEFVDGAEETLGDDAPVAGTLAYDKGYDVTQIVDGVSDRSLQKDGSVTKDGAPVTPARPASNVVDEDDEIQAIDDSLTTIARKLPDDAERGALLLTGILALASDGYTPEQIINDGLLDGGMRFTNEWDIGIFEVDKGKAGKRIKPDLVDAAAEQEESEDFLDGLLDDVAKVATGDDPFSRAGASHKNSFLLTVKADSTPKAALRMSAPIGAASGAKGVVLGEGKGSLSTDTVCAADGKTYPVVIPVSFAAVGERSGGKYAFDIAIVPAGDTGYPTGGSGLQACKDADKATLSGMVNEISATFPVLKVPLEQGVVVKGTAAIRQSDVDVEVSILGA